MFSAPIQNYRVSEIATCSIYEEWKAAEYLNRLGFSHTQKQMSWANHGQVIGPDLGAGTEK
jgi:hypothetical protein